MQISLWVKKVKNLNRYNRSVFFSLPLAFSFLIALLVLGAGDVCIVDGCWFLLAIPMFVGNIVSSSTYIARVIDALVVPSRIWNDENPPGVAEHLGTVIGFVLGIAIAIGLIVVCVTVPFVRSLHLFGKIIFLLSRISIFAGLGNRLGKLVDNPDRPPAEITAIGIVTAIATCIIVVALLTISITALTSAVGLSTIFTGGAAVPLWFMAAIFALTFISNFASAADYGAKAVRYVLSFFIPKKIEISEKNIHDYRGSTFGFTAGMVIAVVIITVFAVQPHVVVGAAGVIACLFIMAMCLSISAGFCSRVGRLVDGWVAAEPGDGTSEESPVKGVSPGGIMDGLGAAPDPALAFQLTPTTDSNPPEHFDHPVTGAYSSAASQPAKHSPPSYSVPLLQTCFP